MTVIRIYIAITLCCLSLLYSLSASASIQDSVRARSASDTLRPTLSSDTTIRKSISTDTTKARKRSTLNDTWYYGSEPNKRYAIDSTITQMHRYDVVRRDGAEYFNLGNTGNEAYPLIFDPAPVVGFNMGFRQFDAYRYQRDSIRYYQVIRPYTELFYSLGTSTEQVIQGRFANSHKAGILYGVDFRRINSRGTYNNQKALDNGFSLYGVYTSKNKRLNIETDMIYNSFVVNENGGLSQDIFFRDTSFFNKNLAPTQLTAAIINYNEIDWFLKGSYNIGKKYNERVSDTAIRKVTLPIFRVSYMLDIERGRYSYFDLKTDSPYYGNTLLTGDTLRYSSHYVKVGDRLGLDFNAKKLTSDSTFKDLNFLMGAALNIDYYMMREFQQSHDFGNVYVSGYLKSNPALNPRLIYKASLAYYLAGYNQNDLSLDGQLGVDLHPYGKLTGQVSYQLRESDWTYHSFRADSSRGIDYTNINGTHITGVLDSISYKYSNNFPKMSTFKLGGEYVLSKYGIRLSAYNYILKNYFYFSAPYTPAYEPRAINVLVLSFSNRFGIKGFHFDNDIWFQKSAGSDVIRLPVLVTKHSVYYQADIFKRAMRLAIGADLRYYSAYFANGYSPLMGQFYEQDVQRMSFYPVLDVFLNVKVKTVRVFLTVTNLSSVFGSQKGYYTGYYYPASDLGFKFGAAWRFFE